MTAPVPTTEIQATSQSRTRSMKRVFHFPDRTQRRPILLRSSLLTLVAALMLAAGLLAGAVPAGVVAQDQEQARSLDAATAWLIDQQGGDGGFPGMAGESDPGVTIDAVIALSAAQATGVDSNLDAAIGYLAENALVIAQTSPGVAAKLALALIAAGEDPHDFANVDPLSIVQMAASNGQIGFGPFDHALGLLALAGAGDEIPEAATTYVFDSQSEDGGWSFDGVTDPGAADTNTTALMVQAAVAAGIRDEAAVDDAVAYLLGTQAEDGGFPYQPAGPSDSNSTSLVIQALLATGMSTVDPVLAAANMALLKFQNENGSFSWMLDPRDDNMFSTVQAIPAVAGLEMPVMAPDVLAPAATPEASPVAYQAAA